MKNLLIILFHVLSFFAFAQKQTTKPATKAAPAKEVKIDSADYKFVCDPFNPEDSLGIIVWKVLNDYEHFSHFALPGETRGKTSFAEGFKSVFTPQAMLPNDMAGPEQLLQKMSVEEYTKLGLSKGYRPFVVIAEKKPFMAKREDVKEDYIGYMRLFKVFNDTARLDKEYAMGAMYELEVHIWGDSVQAAISNITLVDNKVYEKYMLTGFGYHMHSQIMVTNNLDKLLTYKAPPKPKVPKQTKSGFFLHGGYVFTNYLQPEAFAQNLNPNTSFSGTQSGYMAGLQFQKVYGQKGIFGILFGVEYEVNNYDFAHNNITLDYVLDCDGQPLQDAEGNEYERKRAEVKNYEEKGILTLIRPEVGLFLNIGLGQGANIQLFGLVGNAFTTGTYDASATVTYTGYKGNLVLEDRPELGFYRDLEVDFSREHANLQSFMFYRLGASLDINLAKWLAFSVLAEYRGSMTYAIRFREFNCAFLDPADERTFVSQFDYLNASRLYDAVGIQAGFKIYIKEKHRDTGTETKK